MGENSERIDGQSEETSPKRISRFDPTAIEMARSRMQSLFDDAAVSAFVARLVEDRKKPFSNPYPEADEFTRLLAGAMRAKGKGLAPEGYDFIRLNFDRVLDGLDDASRRALSIRAIGNMLDDPNIESSLEELSLATSALEPYVEEMVEKSDLHHALRMLFRWSNAQSRPGFACRCIKVASAHVKPEGVEQCPATRYVSLLCSHSSPEIRSAARAMFSSAIPEGFDIIDLMDAWCACYSSKLHNTTIFENIHAINQLERKEKGAALALYSQFGIRCFSRYSVDQLLEQYRERDNLGKKYGVAVYPLADHNGAFQDDYSILKQVNDELKGLDKGMRIIEAGSPKEIRHRLTTLHRKYAMGLSGGGPKFSFILIAGHGSPSNIQLGIMGRISQRSMHDTSIRSFRAACEEGAEIVLISCSTGVDGGIADKASQTLLSTTGPQSDTSVQSIEVLPADTPAGVILVPHYRSEDGKRHAAKC